MTFHYNSKYDNKKFMIKPMYLKLIYLLRNIAVFFVSLKLFLELNVFKCESQNCVLIK